MRKMNLALIIFTLVSTGHFAWSACTASEKTVTDVAKLIASEIFGELLDNSIKEELKKDSCFAKVSEEDALQIAKKVVADVQSDGYSTKESLADWASKIKICKTLCQLKSGVELCEQRGVKNGEEYTHTTILSRSVDGEPMEYNYSPYSTIHQIGLDALHRATAIAGARTVDQLRKELNNLTCSDNQVLIFSKEHTLKYF